MSLSDTVAASLAGVLAFCFTLSAPASLFIGGSLAVKDDTLKVSSELALLLLCPDELDFKREILSLIGPAPSGFVSEAITPYSFDDECLLECFFSL